MYVCMYVDELHDAQTPPRHVSDVVLHVGRPLRNHEFIFAMVTDMYIQTRHV